VVHSHNVATDAHTRQLLSLPVDAWEAGKDALGEVPKVSFLWVLGVTCACLASFLSTFGVNLQKFSHMQNDRLPEKQQVPYYQQFLWVCGMILLASGSIADFVALAFVAQSLIAPLGAITLIANTLVAPCFLKEVITRQDVYGTIVTSLGCAISVCFANHSETSYQFQELVSFFVNPAYLVFFTVVVLFLFGANSYIDVLEAKDVTGTLPLDHNEKTRPFLYASIGGVAGSFAVTFAKAFVELIKVTLSGQNEFLEPGPYLVTLVLVLFSLMQVHYLNKGLMMFDALYIVPIYQTFWIIGNVFGGIMYYQEFNDFAPRELIMFPIGIIITLVGVAMLSVRAKTYEMLSEDEAAANDERKFLNSADGELGGGDEEDGLSGEGRRQFEEEHY